MIFVLSIVKCLWRFAFRSRASLMAQAVNRLPAMRETWVRSLGWGDPLEKEITTHSSTLAWKVACLGSCLPKLPLLTCKST